MEPVPLQGHAWCGAFVGFACAAALDGFVIKNTFREDGAVAARPTVLHRHQGAAHRISGFPNSYTEFIRWVQLSGTVPGGR